MKQHMYGTFIPIMGVMQESFSEHKIQVQERNKALKPKKSGSEHKTKQLFLYSIARRRKKGSDTVCDST
ncbi:BTE_HP_G0226020.mRNA.1.CDS.1 [Saccharomyces cerevisiae]|nr:BTE_HP_G0226020.mRNA.1.CDS.1 [Saccharomyces cerevisiae]CAI6457813.1 BTE_HP_G0226020.mRNA.1.CDS.1 [Saccharomyces cerevisiae]